LNLLKNTLATFVSQIIAVILSIFISIIIARTLGPTGQGSYAIILLIPTLLTLLANMGIGIANIYFGGQKIYSWADLASNSLFSGIVLGIISALAFVAYYLSFQPSFLSTIVALNIVIAVAAAPFILLKNYFSYILLGQQNIMQYNTLQIGPGLIGLVTVIFLVLVFSYGLFGAVLAWFITTIIISIASILLVWKRTEIKISFNLRLFKESIQFGVKGYFGNVIQFLNYRVDLLIVAYFMSISFVGYYSIAVVMAEALWYLPSAVGTIILAKTSSGSSDEANRMTPQICRNTLFITLVVAIILLGLSRYLIILFYGSTYLPVLTPFLVLLPGVVALSICKVLSNELIGRGKPIINTIAAAISLSINVPLNILFIPMWGIVGAAFASTISYSITSIVVITAFLKISRASIRDTLFIKKEDFQLYKNILLGLRNKIMEKI